MMRKPFWPGFPICKASYQTFRLMKGSNEFLGTVTSCEFVLLGEWFGNDTASGVSG